MKATPTPPHEEEKYQVGPLIGRLLRFTWTFRTRCLQVIFLQLVLLTLGLSGLSLTGLGIDHLKLTVGMTDEEPIWPFGMTPPSDWDPRTILFAIAGTILFLALIRSVLNYAYQMVVGKLVHIEIVANLRGVVFAKLQRLSFRFFDANTSGSIINRVTSDIQSVRMFIDGVVVQSFIMVASLVVYVVYMINIHVTLTLASLATTPLLWWVSAWFSKSTRPAYLKNRQLMDELILSYTENMQGIQMIKGFGIEGHSRERFQQANREVRNQRQEIFWKTSTFAPILSYLPQLNLFILLLYGGWIYIQGEISLGQGLVVFAGLLQQFSNQVGNLSSIVDQLQQALTGARRVFEVLDSPVEVDSPEKPLKLGKVEGHLRFDKIRFRYQPDDIVLEDIDFEVNPGEVIAVAGATGAGKSALMSLIPRFYDPTEGRILLDGKDLRDLDLKELRQNIGFVFQENFLFSNTIRANIAFGNPEATQEQIEKAARIAAAHEFILEFPKGYDTVLGESGINLSGGQRQRLAIARAVLLEPAILLLDDPTASIDPETEGEILEAIDNAIKGRTTFIVAHRLSTLKRAHRILVLKEGRIRQFGTHAELMSQDGPYKRAIEVQAIDPESLRLLQQNRDRQKQRGEIPS